MYAGLLAFLVIATCAAYTTTITEAPILNTNFTLVSVAVVGLSATDNVTLVQSGWSINVFRDGDYQGKSKLTRSTNPQHLSPTHKRTLYVPKSN